MLQTCSALPALYHFHYKLNWYHYYDFLLNWEVFVVNLWGDYSNIEHQHDLLAYKLLDGDDAHDVNGDDDGVELVEVLEFLMIKKIIFYSISYILRMTYEL